MGAPAFCGSHEALLLTINHFAMKKNSSSGPNNWFTRWRMLRLLSGLSAAIVLSTMLITGCKKDDDDDDGGVTLALVADNIASPLGLLEAPDNSGRLFIIDQTGRIWIVNENGTKNATPFLDISSKIVPLNPAYDERGLLGFAFHPDYKT